MAPSLYFYYDIACPYAYMASTRLAVLARRTGAVIAWRPILLGGLYRTIGAPQVPSETWNEAKASLGRRDLQIQAARLGVPLRPPPRHPQRTVEAMRLLVGTAEALRPAVTADLYRAYWVEHRDMTDRAVLAEIARRHGVDPAVIDSPEARQGLFDLTAEAAERGAFGVPTFAAGDRIWWGQDRLPLVEAALRPDDDTAATAPLLPMPSEGPPLVDRVRFFHDLSSPFSYLASTQIDALASARGVEVEWVPILLGALFRSIGTPNVPLFAMSEVKRTYMARDLHDWAARWGVPFRFPSTFPIRTVLPLRVCLLAPAAAGPLYRALWVEDRDIGQPEVVRAVLREAGLDEGLVEATQRPEIKQRLRDNTGLAEAMGVCGVPTVAAGAELFWGQDRLPTLADALDRRFALPPAAQEMT